MTLRIELERNEALLAWYGKRKRDLPWRTEPDAYAILVSEFMLQQTQATRVIPYYHRFLEQYPTIHDLAMASLADVLRLWNGLGYNSRAKRLRDAARIIAESGWPDTPEGLQQLPGVGPYTAAAIASFAFGARVAALDTNARRVLSRWHGEPLDGAVLRRVAEGDLAAEAGDWNQAMMDLGAMVCRPRRPSCTTCPVEPWCSGPDGYVPPPPEPRFEGSARQLRGSIMRALVQHPHSVDDLRRETGFATEEVVLALEDLNYEELIEQDSQGRFQLAD
jgi:A/G-specific adenine glycosylase